MASSAITASRVWSGNNEEEDVAALTERAQTLALETTKYLSKYQPKAGHGFTLAYKVFGEGRYNIAVKKWWKSEMFAYFSFEPVSCEYGVELKASFYTSKVKAKVLGTKVYEMDLDFKLTESILLNETGYHTIHIDYTHNDPKKRDYSIDFKPTDTSNVLSQLEQKIDQEHNEKKDNLQFSQPNQEYKGPLTCFLELLLNISPEKHRVIAATQNKEGKYHISKESVHVPLVINHPPNTIIDDVQFVYPLLDVVESVRHETISTKHGNIPFRVYAPVILEPDRVNKEPEKFSKNFKQTRELLAKTNNSERRNKIYEKYLKQFSFVKNVSGFLSDVSTYEP